MRPICLPTVPRMLPWLCALALIVLAVPALAVPPVAPTLLAPADNATNLATTVEFRWMNAAGSQTSTLQISEVDTFATTEYDKTTDTSAADGIIATMSNLRPGTKYFWRVRNTNGTGTTAEDGPWAATRNFTVAAAAYDTPTLIGPANNAASVDVSATLTWNLPTGCTGREVQIATKDDFTQGVQKDATETATATFSLAPNKDYWWRVQGKTATGVTPWSAVWKFKTANRLPAPVLVTPADRATGVGRPPEMTWQQVNGADRYLVQYDTAADFTTAREYNFYPTGATTEMYEPMRLAAETTYYWRVVALNLDAARRLYTYGDWSNARTFTTSAEPERPSLVSPYNAASINRPVTLTWLAPDGATSYQLNVSTDSNFANLVVDADLGNVLSLKVDTLKQQTTYYWRVKAWGDMGDSRWSRVWKFTVLQDPLSPPVLRTPANGATGVSLPPSLTWLTTTGATHYKLQVSTYPYYYYYANVIDTAATPASQAPDLSTLLPNTTYYWRVMLLDQVSLPTRESSYSATWSFTTAPPRTKPLAPTLVAPYNGATSVARPVAMRWTASANATGYKLQLARDAAFTNGLVSTVIQGGTVTTKDAVSPVASTTYYWRMLAFNTYGSSDWTTVASFTTAGDPPSTRPALTAPANSVTGQPTNVTLTWSTVSGATGYTIQYGADSTFPALSTQTLTANGLTTNLAGLANATKYFWRVRGSNTVGDGPWSSTFAFTTAVAPPAAPLLASPVNGATDIVRGTEKLIWTPVIGATAHKIIVARDAALTAILYQRELGATVDREPLANMVLDASTTYWWAVMARNSAGWSVASEVWSFTTITTAPVAPVLSGPANSATSVATSATLTWLAGARATSYRVEVSASPSFATPVYGSEVQDISVAPPGLAAATMYWWRVKSINIAGESGWTSAWSFTTAAALATPSPTGPTRNATGVATPAIFTWSAVPGAAGYLVQVATSAAFAPTLAEVPATGETATVSGLDPAMTYVWRVKATGAAGDSLWSTPWSFTTRALPPAPAVPILQSPVNGGRIGVLPMTVQWGARADVAGYDLQVAADAQFTTLAVDLANQTATTSVLDTLQYGTRYYWRVRAVGTGQPSAWSTVWSFVTGGPELLTPANNAAGLTGAVVCTWSGATDGASYTVQVSTVEDFQDGPLRELRAVVGMRAEVANLPLDATYYWRVRANNATGGAGAWSPVFHFAMLAKPGAVTPLTPTAGAAGLALPVRLTWAAVPQATSYVVTIVGKPSITTTGTSVVPSGLAAGNTYTWSVVARNAAGDGPASDPRNFSTSATLPKSTYLVSPGNGAALALPITFTWASGAVQPTDVVYYWLQVSTTASFASPIVNAGQLTTNSYRVTNLPAGLRYYWRVRTWNASGQTNWTPYRYFDLPASSATVPAVPVQTTPANDAPNVTAPVALSWGVAAGADGYALQVATDLAFTRMVVNTESLRQTSFTAANLASGTQYWWRVKAWNVKGASAWSAVRTFTTGTPSPLGLPGVPALLTPLDGAQGVLTLPARLTWGTATGATTYKVQVSTAADFSSLTVNATIPGTSAETAALLGGTTYYWRVAGINDMGTGDWSTVRSFKTK